MTPSERIADLQRRLEDRASEEKRAWWEAYLRGTASFRGVPMADVRSALHAWHADHALGSSFPEAQVRVALELLRQEQTEDKLAGILYFQEILLPSGEPEHRALLPHFVGLFDEGHLADWNAVDWFCVKVLAPLVERDGEPCARALREWRDGATLWQRRASAVAFVNLVKRGEIFPGFQAMVLESCEVLVTDPARFSQTGAGWVLREMSLATPGIVEDFVRGHLARMSREAVKSAVKKLPAETQDEILEAHRVADASGGNRAAR